MKRFAFEMTENDNGLLSFKSENDGFNGLELMAALQWKIDDIRQQLRGEVKPDIVERKRVVEVD